MPSKTNYYDFDKPDIDGSEDVWGGILNADLDKIDEALRNCLLVDTHPAFNTPLTANVTNLPLYVPAQADSSAVQHAQLAATQGWVEGRILRHLNFFFPVGSIMIWSGLFGTMPPGWTFCDGTNGAPDLRARFILCASNIAPLHYPWAAAGNPSQYPGNHTHQLSYNFYPGPASTAPPIPVADGQALYNGEYPTLPYFVLMYIYKYAAW